MLMWTNSTHLLYLRIKLTVVLAAPRLCFNFYEMPKSKTMTLYLGT